MTLRGAGLLLGGIGAVAAGWYANWPELSVLGVAAVIVVLLAVVATAGRSPVAVSWRNDAMRAVRKQPVEVHLTLVPRRRRRALRVVEGDPARPRRTVPVRGGRGPVEVAIPIDTSRRGRHELGPFSVVKGDPWSIVRAVVGSSPSGEILVRPRTHPVRRGFAVSSQVGEAEALTRRRGDDHFFALRDYVLGDEARNVHWRSSARSGRLVVRQKMSAASEGVLVVLDTDQSAYAAGGSFEGGFDEDRFETAVEVAASLCLARMEAGDHVSLTTTARVQARNGQERDVSRLLDGLAVVESVLPIDSAPEELPLLVRRSKSAQLVVVSGQPNAGLLAGLAACRSFRPTLVRIGGRASEAHHDRPVPGTLTLDVESAEALA